LHDTSQGVEPSTSPLVQVSPFVTLAEMYDATVVMTCGEAGFDLFHSGLTDTELLALLEGWVNELKKDQALNAPTRGGD